MLSDARDAAGVLRPTSAPTRPASSGPDESSPGDCEQLRAAACSARSCPERPAVTTGQPLRSPTHPREPLRVRASPGRCRRPYWAARPAQARGPAQEAAVRAGATRAAHEQQVAEPQQRAGDHLGREAAANGSRGGPTACHRSTPTAPLPSAVSSPTPPTAISAGHRRGVQPGTRVAEELELTVDPPPDDDPAQERDEHDRVQIAGDSLPRSGRAPRTGTSGISPGVCGGRRDDGAGRDREARPGQEGEGPGRGVAQQQRPGRGRRSPRRAEVEPYSPGSAALRPG